MLKYETINEELERKIPEVNNVVKNITRFYENKKIPSHIFYSETVNLLLYKLLTGELIDDDLEKRIFAYIEEMSNSSDDEVRNLVQVTILEFLWSKPTILNKAEKLMGLKTQSINQEVAMYLQRPT